MTINVTYPVAYVYSVLNMHTQTEIIERSLVINRQVIVVNMFCWAVLVTCTSMYLHRLSLYACKNRDSVIQLVDVCTNTLPCRDTTTPTVIWPPTQCGALHRNHGSIHQYMCSLSTSRQLIWFQSDEAIQCSASLLASRLYMVPKALGGWCSIRDYRYLYTMPLTQLMPMRARITSHSRFLGPPSRNMHISSPKLTWYEDIMRFEWLRWTHPKLL